MNSYVAPAQENPLTTIASATKTAAGEKTIPAAVLYGIAAAVALTDQWVKAWASAHLRPMDTLPVLPGVFHLTYTENRGMAFSLLEGQTGLLVAAAVLVIGGIVWAQTRIGARLPVVLCLSLALALGGALGNLIDRARLGYVVDLFDARIIRFPIFNVADTAITFGIVLLAWRVALSPATSAEDGEPPPLAGLGGQP